MRIEYVVVVCTASDGTPTAPTYRIEVTEEEYELGIHYDKAEEEALEENYEKPFTCFDNSEHDEIIRTAFFLEQLKEAGLVD